MALPSGYTQLEYIQSTGTQYINTGVVATSKTRVVIEAQYPTAPTDNNSALFGERNANVNEFWCYYRPSSDGFSCRFGDGGSNRIVAGTPTDRNVLDMNSNVLTINGSASVTATSATFTSSYQMYLFAVNNAGTAQYQATAIIYSCQIYDNGTLVRDFVPALRGSDDVVGLYDVVNGVFYTNAGSGAFTAGLVAGPSGHRTLMDGTDYEITAGTVMASGTIYEIVSGKVLKEGTVYNLVFGSAPDEPAVPDNTITFTVNGVTYTADKGMTWGNWVKSSYNTGKFYVAGNMVYSSTNQIIWHTTFIAGNMVIATDQIVTNRAYRYN